MSSGEMYVCYLGIICALLLLGEPLENQSFLSHHPILSDHTIYPSQILYRTSHARETYPRTPSIEVDGI